MVWWWHLISLFGFKILNFFFFFWLTSCNWSFTLVFYNNYYNFSFSFCFCFNVVIMFCLCNFPVFIYIFDILHMRFFSLFLFLFLYFCHLMSILFWLQNIFHKKYHHNIPKRLIRARCTLSLKDSYDWCLTACLMGQLV